MTLGHLVFGLLVAMNVCGYGKARVGPTLFRET